VHALDAKKLKVAIKARGLVGVNVKPLLWADVCRVEELDG